MTAVEPRAAVPVAAIGPDPAQPRQYVQAAALAELVASMKANGLAVPILLRRRGDRFVIVHGERRWRAARDLGWQAIPAEVRDLDDEQARWLQLVENLNRADLSPTEEARAYAALLATGVSRDTLAGRVGKSRSYIAQKLRLLDLPAPFALLCDRGALSEGHVRQLLRIRGLYTDQHTLGRVGSDDYTAWQQLWREEPVCRDTFVLLVLTACRPEDWPPGYPFTSTDPLVADATEALCDDVATAGAAYPWWVLPAFYFAALTVTAGASVADLDKLLDGWIERIHGALIGVTVMHKEPLPMARALGELAELLWWDYRSDLRHAGLLDAHEHIDLVPIMRKAFSDESYALPSQCQPGSPHADTYQRLTAGRWSR